ncbi:LysR family transcriptional regulator [Orrella sp. JC864]|uniref:LysR family transcriptional regulator n=1 Tax=Orrella sp. JC864 TaxID=3120298 RepID=UPI00300B3005
MLSRAQLETFYWVARLGTLRAAAERLHVTQSAVTKRLQEVESLAAEALFEHPGRKNTLTPAGRLLFHECEQLLETLDRLDRLKSPGMPARLQISVGLTELSVMTWFPAFLGAARLRYPDVVIQPTVEDSSTLIHKAESGTLDLCVVAESPESPALHQIEIGAAEFGWFAAPGTFEAGRIHTLHALTRHTFIEQNSQSIVNTLCAQVYAATGAQPERLPGGNNVFALAGLIRAHGGVSCLPVALFREHEASGRLQRVHTDPPLRPVRYYAVFRKYPQTAWNHGLAEIARQCCDFETS